MWKKIGDTALGNAHCTRRTPRPSPLHGSQPPSTQGIEKPRAQALCRSGPIMTYIHRRTRDHLTITLPAQGHSTRQPLRARDAGWRRWRAKPWFGLNLLSFPHEMGTLCQHQVAYGMNVFGNPRLLCTRKLYQMRAHAETRCGLLGCCKTLQGYYTCRTGRKVPMWALAGYWKAHTAKTALAKPTGLC